MLLGPSGSVEVIEEPMEVDEPVEEKEKTPEPAPLPVKDVVANSFMKLLNIYMEPEVDTPASPPPPAAPASPPASPPVVIDKDLERILNSLRGNKGESGGQDMDLRQAQSFSSQPKIIPVGFCLSAFFFCFCVSLPLRTDVCHSRLTLTLTPFSSFHNPM